MSREESQFFFQKKNYFDKTTFDFVLLKIFLIKENKKPDNLTCEWVAKSRIAWIATTASITGIRRWKTFKEKLKKKRLENKFENQKKIKNKKTRFCLKRKKETENKNKLKSQNL